MSQAGPGPVGYIFHEPSKKLIHPLNGAYDPPEGFNIVVYGDKDGPGRLQFRFVPQDGEWGHIEHVSSGKILYLKPPEHYQGDAQVCLMKKLDPPPPFPFKEAYFKIDQKQKEIVHISEMVWQPADGGSSPGDNTIIVLRYEKDAAAKFYFGDRSGEPLNVTREK